MGNFFPDSPPIAILLQLLAGTICQPANHGMSPDTPILGPIRIHGYSFRLNSKASIIVSGTLMDLPAWVEGLYVVYTPNGYRPGHIPYMVVICQVSSDVVVL